jgi:hypothetical protein
VVVGDRAPPHQRRHHGHVDDFRKRHQQFGCIGIDDAAAGDNQRTLGGVEHGERLLDLPARGGGLVDGQRLIGLVVELDFGQLHVERQVDQHRARAARAHDVERLAEHARHQRRLPHRDRPFRHRLCDCFDINRLKVFLVKPRARRLAGDAEDRDRIRDRRVKPGDHVGAGRARGTDADADIARFGAGIAFGHMRSALDMARQDMADRAAPFQRGIQRVDRGTRHAEGGHHALFFEDTHRGIDRSHLRHFETSLMLLDR